MELEFLRVTSEWLKHSIWLTPNDLKILLLLLYKDFKVSRNKEVFQQLCSSSQTYAQAAKRWTVKLSQYSFVWKGNCFCRSKKKSMETSVEAPLLVSVSKTNKTWTFIFCHLKIQKPSGWFWTNLTFVYPCAFSLLRPVCFTLFTRKLQKLAFSNWKSSDNNKINDL